MTLVEFLEKLACRLTGTKVGETTIPSDIAQAARKVEDGTLDDPDEDEDDDGEDWDDDDDDDEECCTVGGGFGSAREHWVDGPDQVFGDAPVRPSQYTTDYRPAPFGSNREARVQEHWIDGPDPVYNN